MSEKYKKLIEILNNLNLSEQDRTNFLNILLFIPDNDYEELSQAIEQDPNLVKEVLENYKVKKQALESGDKEQWDRVIEDEKKELENA